MTRFRLSAVLFLAVLTGVAAAQTVPASGVATAPASMAAVEPAADYSTPLAAVQAFVRASFGQDAGAMREALLIPAGREGEVDAFLGSMEASRKLQAAAQKKFGIDGEKAFNSGGPTMAAQLKDVAAGTVEVLGNSATVTLPSATMAPGRVVVLRKNGESWKIDAMQFFDLDVPAAKVAERVELAKKVTDVAQQSTKMIQAGKFLSATDAYQDFWTRCLKVTGTAPASAPATGTAPATEAKP